MPYEVFMVVEKPPGEYTYMQFANSPLHDLERAALALGAHEIVGRTLTKSEAKRFIRLLNRSVAKGRFR